MVWIPAGRNVGMNPLEPGESFEEWYPRIYSVRVDGFYMDRYEVTNDKMTQVLNWAFARGKLTISRRGLVRNAEGSRRVLLDCRDEECRITWDGRRFVTKSSKGAGHPCVEVTWYGAVAYCNYRTQMEDRELTPCYDLRKWSCDFGATGYRLPREGEWEYAARGGIMGSRFPWGDTTIGHGQANYYSSSQHPYDVSQTRGHHPDYNHGTFPYTSPVGAFERGKNAYGLYDMAGNVWEWCWDAWGVHRVVRGGSWYFSATGARAGARFWYPPKQSYCYVGFRACRVEAK